jgi:hypothetical protein
MTLPVNGNKATMRARMIRQTADGKPLAVLKFFLRGAARGAYHWAMTPRRSHRNAFLAFLLALSDPAWAADRFVSTMGSDTANNCLSSASPCLTIGHALTQVTSGDVVKLTRGSYDEDVLINASLTVTLSGSWEPDFSSSEPERYLTVLAGDLRVEAGLGETIDVTVDGFTVTRSHGVVALSSDDGALSLTLTSCAVKRNKPGGIGAFSSQTSTLALQISDSTISANRTSPGSVFLEASDTSVLTLAMSDSSVERSQRNITLGGQGIYLSGLGSASLAATLTRTVVARSRKFGILAFGAFLELSDSSVVRNRGGGIGAGLGAAVTITNSVVARNRGGGIVFSGPSMAILNSTVIGNRAGCSPPSSSCSGGIGVGGVGTIDLTNTIVWGNTAGNDGADNLTNAGATVNIDHSDLGPGVNGGYNDLGGNISADPLFVSRGDPHLTAGSPAIDTGTCVGAPAADFEGDPRPTGGGCDMGADEFVP